MATLAHSFKGKRVLVTGHTGFKGSWLCECLLDLGAEVWGFSLPPATRPALFTQLGLRARLNGRMGDLRDPREVSKVVSAAWPDYVFHLAAQPLVREAHLRPADTWSTNVMGTVNLLEALRQLKKPCAAVIVTTDKVYGGGTNAHGEGDPLNAQDPYGASKAAVEFAANAWRKAFFCISERKGGRFPNVAFATARAGNVIGGGDWASDRLLPDCVRALRSGKTIPVRNPLSVRPWQHVLDPLSGYMKLAAELRSSLIGRDARRLADLSGAFNFGPSKRDHRSVGELVDAVTTLWPGKWKQSGHPAGIVETAVLRLDARKAAERLGWSPKWSFGTSVAATVAWYRGVSSPRQAPGATRGQIRDYSLH
jgi:CDP-glucose 4,6-dehydratase